MTFHPSEDLSATPLVSLPGIVLDTETTGLDTVRARVVQIGAIRISGSKVHTDDQFDSLVAPGEPIPASSTAIHGISDDDVTAADDFPIVMARLVSWAGPTVIIGYSIGFDLAVLEAEHKRGELKWKAPRSLDVRHIVQILSPNLPDHSLDTVADWLGVTIKNRHSALGDAVATADVYAALVPKLRARGINTLAEAERACRKLASQIDTEAQAGWHAVSGAGDTEPRSVAEYARIDSYPYRHQVRDIMHTPPRIVDHSTTVRDALSLMMREQVSSVFVTPEQGDAAYGIVTERDILRTIDTDPDTALNQTVAPITKRPLVCVPQDEFLYRAIGMMNAGNFRHLGVSGDGIEPVGALSARDLLKQRASDALSLGDSIETARTAEDLGRIWADLTTVARGLVYEEVDPRDIAAVISRELRALTSRACHIAEQEMAEQGNGSPPVPYAMLVLGSGGRGESLLAMDQDNAIVYTEGERDSDTDKWFAALGKRVSEILNMVGVSYCDGGIMASNAEWRMQQSDWQEMITGWIGRSKPKDIMNCDIFFDSIPVHGDIALGNTLRREALPIASENRNFLKMLSMNTVDFQVPLGWFGRFQTESGRIDLKKGGILPIFSAARVLAIQSELPQRSTPERLEAARDRIDLPRKIIDNLIDAHRILLGAILDQQLRDIDAGVSISNKVAPETLSSKQRDELKWALEQLGSISDLVGNPVLTA